MRQVKVRHQGDICAKISLREYGLVTQGPIAATLNRIVRSHFDFSLWQGENPEGDDSDLNSVVAISPLTKAQVLSMKNNQILFIYDIYYGSSRYQCM